MPTSCKKIELKENINDPFDPDSSLVSDRNPTEADTAKVAMINMFSQYDVLPLNQKNADWFYQQVPSAFVDIETWKTWKRMARDIANIYGEDKNLSRVFDYFQQKQSLNASLRQFAMDFSAKANNLISVGASATAMSSFCSQNSLRLQTLYGTSISNEELNSQIFL